jgi:hypothetical protein
VWEEVHFAIQLLPFFSCWTLYVLAWTTLWVLLINNPDLLDRNPFGVWFLVLIPIARGAAFFYESKSHGLQDVEFDEWYSGLYGDIILFEGSAFMFTIGLGLSAAYWDLVSSLCQLAFLHRSTAGCFLRLFSLNSKRE